MTKRAERKTRKNHGALGMEDWWRGKGCHETGLFGEIIDKKRLGNYCM